LTEPSVSPSKAEKHIIWAFCIITAVIPFFSINVPRSFAFIPGISGIVFFALYYFLGSEKPALSKKTALFVAITIGLSALSLLWAKNLDDSKEKVIKLLALLPPQILVISLATSLKKEQLKPLAKMFPIAFIASSTFLAFEILTKGTLHNILRGESVSFIADPDDFNRGAVALSIYAFSAFALACTFFKKNIATILIFVPVAIAILISESFSAQIALCAGLLFLFAFPYKSNAAHKTLKFSIIFLMIAAPFIATPFYDHLAHDLQNNPILANAYAGHRMEIWDFISRYILQSPFIGYGIEATREITDFESRHIFNKANTTLHPHNFALQIWIEFGIVGILIGSGLIYALFTNIEKQFSPAQQKIILPTLIATLIPASVAYGLWQGLWIGMMFHVAAVALMTGTLIRRPSKP